MANLKLKIARARCDICLQHGLCVVADAPGLTDLSVDVCADCVKELFNAANGEAATDFALCELGGIDYEVWSSTGVAVRKTQ